MEIEMLKKEYNRLQQIKQKTEQELQNSPQGFLKIANIRNHNRYYWQNGAKILFLRNEQTDIARKLSQKSYDKKVLKSVNHQLLAISSFLKNYHVNALKDIFLP